jgi:hypothetical protein
LKVFQNSTVITKTLIENVLPSVRISGIKGPHMAIANSTVTFTPEGISGGVPSYKYFWYVQYLIKSYPTF